jgi:hypothetical protein
VFALAPLQVTGSYALALAAQYNTLLGLPAGADCSVTGIACDGEWLLGEAPARRRLQQQQQQQQQRVLQQEEEQQGAAGLQKQSGRRLLQASLNISTSVACTYPLQATTTTLLIDTSSSSSSGVAPDPQQLAALVQALLVEAAQRAQGLAANLNASGAADGMTAAVQQVFGGMIQSAAAGVVGANPTVTLTSAYNSTASGSPDDTVTSTVSTTASDATSGGSGGVCSAPGQCSGGWGYAG